MKLYQPHIVLALQQQLLIAKQSPLLVAELVVVKRQLQEFA
jgi:hypothetical protein